MLRVLKAKLGRSPARPDPPAPTTPDPPAPKVEDPKKDAEWQRLNEELVALRKVALNAKPGGGKRSGKPPPLGSAIPEDTCLELGAEEGGVDLRRKARKAMAKARDEQIAQLLKEAQQADWLFLVDCTGSMDSYISAAKTKVQDIARSLGTKFDQLQLRVGFVGYRDHCDKEARLVCLDFTKNLKAVADFLEGVEAKGGGDAAEDVFGGLQMAGSLSWSTAPNAVRMLYHIADAPCHGRRFHTPGCEVSDNHPDGDPNGLQVEALLRVLQLDRKVTNYHISHVHSNTTRHMAAEFRRVCLLGNEWLTEDMMDSADIPSSMQAALHRSISTQIGKVTSGSGGGVSGPPPPALVRELPDWSTLPEYYARHTRQRPPASLQELLNRINCDYVHILDESTTYVSVQIAKNPFDMGGIRVAYHGRLGQSTTPKDSRDIVVVKDFIVPDLRLRDHYQQQMNIQSVTSFLASEYHKALPPGEEVYELHYCQTQLLELCTATPRWFTVEPFLPGTWCKWTSNCGYARVDKHSEAVQAFTHWTFEHTAGYMMVVDVQGKVDDAKRQFLLTDPAIHCQDLTCFAPTNLGTYGMGLFFKNHVCGNLCKRLKLKKRVDHF